MLHQCLSSSVLLYLLVAGGARLSTAQDAGEVELNILGGEDVLVDEYNSVVGLSIRAKTGRSTATCSGSILNDRWILTAGHCVTGKTPATHDVYVLVGSKSLADARNITAEKFFAHEWYKQVTNPVRVFYDIALVKLSQSLMTYRNVAPALLPYQNEYLPPQGSTVTVVGYGVEGQGALTPKSRRGVMKKADMLVSGTCTNTFPYCIRTINKSGRSCPGDSGGPMMYQGKVIGVSSTGTTCNMASGNAQYTRVSPYIDWIKGHLSRN